MIPARRILSLGLSIVVASFVAFIVDSWLKDRPFGVANCVFVGSTAAFWVIMLAAGVPQLRRRMLGVT